MRRRLIWGLLLCGWAIIVRAEQPAPRDIWPQATAAADSGDVDLAIKKTNELTETGRSYGIRTYPLYASAAAALASQADKQNQKDVAAWAAKAAAQLDPKSPSVAFSLADRAAAQKSWTAALQADFRGIANVFVTYRTRLLSQADMIIAASLALALTAAVFAIALFIRYGRAMAHDFREILGQSFRGGSVTVLAFALLFLPLFVWLGPVWLVFYWFIIFFGYAGILERILIVLICLVVAALPVALDKAANWTAGVDSPVVMSAIASAERSYQPEALRRVQELVGLIPDNADLQLLLGNLQLQDGNEPQASVHYRRSVELKDSAGAHVNIGNLHFLDNDFAAAITEYEKAQQLDSKLAIAYYNHSVASGEVYKFDEQGRQIEQAKQLDRAGIERLLSNPPMQKIVIYHPSIAAAWDLASNIAKRGNARSIFGNYSYFDPVVSATNPVTIGAGVTIILAMMLWLRRRARGFAGQCIKCGRTFCHRCKSARESATYCTQCIHIYLKRDGVSLDTKRSKLEEVSDYHTGMATRNRIFATFLPGSAQLIEGRTIAGLLGVFLFLLFVSIAVLIGRLAPAIGPVAETAKLLVRVVFIVLAILMWVMMSLPVYKRRVVVT
ncbi:MAG TPA: tetratricopeptide repeat protein [Thermoanaerobaculia bacterium]|nr:tetratricopeptide repeat protein [Thermoanaerobaculia bacterium]